MMKKFLFTFLAVVLLLLAIPMALYATDTDGMTFDDNTKYEVSKKLEEVPMSVEAWVTLPTDAGRAGVVFGNYMGSTTPCFDFEIHKSGNPRIYVAENTTGERVLHDVTFKNVDVRKGEPVHVAVTYDPTKGESYCYVNGVLEQTIAHALNLSDEVCDVAYVLGGDQRDGNGQYFKGAIKSVAVYSDLRSADEIKLAMNKVDLEDEGLIAYYNTDTLSNDSLKDESGNGYDVKKITRWIDNQAPVEDYAYSFCVVGDTQRITYSYPDKLSAIYDWILENKDDKKIKFVFGLGDITDKSTDAEWAVAKEQIFKLNGVVPYSLVRGNHDTSSKINEYFAKPEYMNQFSGFYEGNKIDNSWRVFKVGNVDYLLITFDYGPSDAVLNWASNIIEAHPNHKVIITTHCYLYNDGTTLDVEDACPPNKTGADDGVSNNGDQMWDKLVSKHKNIFLVLSGHDPCSNVIATQTVGDHGNVVTQMLVDPQSVDKAEGATGMVAMLYFSKDGKTLTVEQYSTVKEKHYMNTSQFTLPLPEDFGAFEEDPDDGENDGEEVVTPPETGSEATNTPKTYNTTGDYYYRFNFDSAQVDTEYDGVISKFGESDSNPYGFSLDGSVLGSVKAYEDGSGNYYAARYTNKTWRGMRFSLIKDNVDYSVANGVEISFRFRWVGTGEVSDGANFSFVGIRRAKTSGNYGFNLLSANVDQTTGELIIKANTSSSNSYEIYRIPKMSETNKDFTEFRVVYHDVTNTYSVYINGKAYVESLQCALNPRGSDVITTTYDEDFFAKRTQIAGASDKWSLQLFRIDKSGSRQYNYHFDVDDIIIREGDWFSNSFETAGTNLNAIVGEKVVSTNVFYARYGNATIVTEENGNKYLNMNPGSRLDVTDYAYQLFQDGNWSVDFKLRASGAANILRLFDRVGTSQFLHVTADGALKLGDDIIPDVVVPGVDSDDWVHLTVSVLVDDVNKGAFENFINYSTSGARRGYRIALWVNGEYVGMTSKFARAESTGANGFLLNDYQITTTAVAEADIPTSGLTKIAEKNGITTYQDADANYYQVQYTDGAFVAAVKITKGSQTLNDVLGIFDGGNSQAAIDDLTIYKGVGPKSYATDKKDTEGVVADIDFGKIATTSIHQMTETPHNSGGGVLYTNATSTSTHFTRVAATASERAYVKAAGTTKGSFDIRADHTGGKVFEASITLRNVDNKQDVSLLILRRQALGTSGFVRGYNLTLEANTNYVYFKQNGTKYYLCDENGTKLNLKTNEWVKLTAVFDETGTETLVSYLVNDKPAWCTIGNVTVASISYSCIKPAVALSGVIPQSAYDARNYYDQRVRLYEMEAGSGFAFDLLETSVEYSSVPSVEFEEKTYADFAMIDFADYKNIDELKAEFGDQIYINGNVTIENGVLNVPAGARFAWLDMNNTFAKHWPVSQAVANGMFVNGYTVEMRLKTDFTGDGLLKVNLVCGADSVARTAKLATVEAQADGNAISGSTLPLNKLSSDRFSDVSFTFTNSAMYSSVFVDGNYVGNAGFWKQFNANDQYVSFEVPAGSQLEKLYIHADITRELAMESGEIFRLDPTVYNPIGSVWKSVAGITNNGGMLKDSTYAGVLTHESEDEKFDFIRIDFKHADDDPDSDAGVNTGHAYIDISLTNYLTNKTSIVEFNLRFTPHEKESGIKMGLAWFRLATGASSNHFGESLLDLAGNGTLYYLDKVLRDANGDPIVLSSEDWTNVAVIYDAPAGHVGFRVGGKVPYYLEGENLVLADKIQLPDSITYNLDAYETRLRTFSCAASTSSSFYGTLDVAYLDVYTVDSTVNAGYVGVQTDDYNNLRLVAGTDMLYYSNVGFEVEAFDANGNPLAESSKDYASNIVYSSIVETVGGVAKNVYPEEYGYRYFYTATVEGIPQVDAVKLNVTPFTTIGGVKYKASTVTLDIDLSKNANAVTTNSVEVKPTGDNVDKNANFSLTDVVTYTKDGGLKFNGRGAQFAFAADLDGGVVTLNLTNNFVEVVEATELEVYIDNVLVDTLTLDFGHHTLVLAEGLKGEHSFKLVKKTGGDNVTINNFSVNGDILAAPVLAEENAVNVVIQAPESGSEYGSAYVYVRTSDESGKYYIGYRFSYINWGTNNYDYTNGAANSQNNAHMYRINTATLVEKTANGYSKIFDVLQGGEISLAIKEVWNGQVAKDFVGGWHGDENIENGQVYWYLDGEPLDLTKAGNYTGTQFVFDQTCLIDRCDTEETQIMRHRQYMLLDTNGLRNKQTVEFLVGDFVGDRSQTYLQMCTFNRQNFSLSAEERVKPENYVCDAFNMLDANGGINSSHDVSTHVPEDKTKTMGYSDKNRYVEYLGNDNGLYGLVGFVINDASMYARSVGIMVRETQGDNKLYASFANHFAASVPKYEVWSVDDYYYIDYNTANAAK